MASALTQVKNAGNGTLTFSSGGMEPDAGSL